MPGSNARARIKILLYILTVVVLALLIVSNLFPTTKPVPTIPPTNTGIGTSSVVAPAPSAVTVAYYVSPNGSDTNPGTASAPFRTIAKGVSVLQPGYALYLMSGTYKLSAPLTISKSGTAASPITISTAPGQTSKAIITGDINGDGVGEVPAKGSWSGMVSINGSYIYFMNMDVRYSGGRGIVSNGSYVNINGNAVHNTWRSGIQMLGSYNAATNNTVYRAAESNYCGLKVGRMCNGNWDAGIAWGDPHYASAPGRANHTIVRGNTVFNNSGEGIICMHSDYATIENNTAYDNWALNIDLDQCSYATVQKNFAYYTANTAWWRTSSRPGVNIMLSNEGIKDSSGRTYPIGHDRKVINNIMVGGGANFYFWTGFQASSAMINDLIADNTMVNTQGTGSSNLKIDAGPHTNSRVMNNIIVQDAGTIAYVGSARGISFNHNNWSKTPPTGLGSASDFVGNPLLMSPNQARTPGATNPSWYKINTTSPVVNRAAVLTEVGVDYWNTPRPSTPDMGANEAKP